MNPHAFRHVILSHACLPIPALPRSSALYAIEEATSIIGYNIRPYGYRFAYSYNYLEAILSRVIQINGVGKERNRLTRATVLALRELAQQSEPTSKSRRFGCVHHHHIRADQSNGGGFCPGLGKTRVLDQSRPLPLGLELDTQDFQGSPSGFARRGLAKSSSILC